MDEMAFYMMIARLCYYLDVDMPNVVKVKSNKRGELCRFDIDDCCLKLATDDTTKLLVYDMAYSIRKLHQRLHNSKILQKPVYDKDGDMNINHPSEIDAHAYATLFMDIEFRDVQRRMELPQEVLKKVSERIKEIMDEAKIMKPYVGSINVSIQEIVDRKKAYNKTHRRRWRESIYDTNVMEFTYPESCERVILDYLDEIKAGKVEVPPLEQDCYTIWKRLADETREAYEVFKDDYGQLPMDFDMFESSTDADEKKKKRKNNPHEMQK